MKKHFEFTNVDKVFFPEEGYTKGDLLQYYANISKYILPYLKDRPLVLYRCPNGIGKDCFYHKDVRHMPPEWVPTVEVVHEDQRKLRYIMAQNQETVLYVINLGCIDLNPFSSRHKSLQYADYLVIDLDPEDISFDAVIEAAQAIHQTLKEAGLKGYCKTSGATGMHIYVPLAAKYTFAQTKEFANLIVILANRHLPHTTSLERSPAKRKKRVYLDYLQNRWGQTVASPYSIRPKPHAPVSTPLKWEEVKKGLDPLNFNMKNIFTRLEKLGDIFKPVLGRGANLSASLKKLEKML